MKSWLQRLICIFRESASSHVMLCFDPCSALFVPILPNTSLIFSSLFMSQCKLIHVDSLLKRRSVHGGLLRLCVCVCARHSVSCMSGASSKMHGGDVRSDVDVTAYRARVSLREEYRHCKHPDISRFGAALTR